MNTQQLTTIVIENAFNYRLAWRDKVTKVTVRGNFRFESPADAFHAYQEFGKLAPNCEIWLEDKSGRRVAIPGA